jgi:hypothetical protein
VSQEQQHGSIVVTEKGPIVLLTGLDLTGEMLGSGVVPIFDEGIILGSENTGVRFRIPKGQGLRVVPSSWSSPGLT